MSNLNFPSINGRVLSPHDYWYAPDGTKKRSLLIPNGSTFNENSYPLLYAEIGGTTLPDMSDQESTDGAEWKVVADLYEGDE